MAPFSCTLLPFQICLENAHLRELFIKSSEIRMHNFEKHCSYALNSRNRTANFYKNQYFRITWMNRSLVSKIAAQYNEHHLETIFPKYKSKNYQQTILLGFVSTFHIYYSRERQSDVICKHRRVILIFSCLNFFNLLNLLINAVNVLLHLQRTFFGSSSTGFQLKYDG